MLKTKRYKAYSTYGHELDFVAKAKSRALREQGLTLGGGSLTPYSKPTVAYISEHSEAFRCLVNPSKKDVERFEMARALDEKDREVIRRFHQMRDKR
jgi:hypothetical protein